MSERVEWVWEVGAWPDIVSKQLGLVYLPWLWGRRWLVVRLCSSRPRRTAQLCWSRLGDCRPDSQACNTFYTHLENLEKSGNLRVVRENRKSGKSQEKMCCCMHEIWPIGSQENHWNCCHQMSHFKAKMHQIRFRLGLRPRPCWGSSQRSPKYNTHQSAQLAGC